MVPSASHLPLSIGFSLWFFSHCIQSVYFIFVRDLVSPCLLKKGSLAGWNESDLAVRGTAGLAELCLKPRALALYLALLPFHHSLPSKQQRDTVMFYFCSMLILLVPFNFCRLYSLIYVCAFTAPEQVSISKRPEVFCPPLACKVISKSLCSSILSIE